MDWIISNGYRSIKKYKKTGKCRLNYKLKITLDNNQLNKFFKKCPSERNCSQKIDHLQIILKSYLYFRGVE